jgi:hypothetical protein
MDWRIERGVVQMNDIQKGLRGYVEPEKENETNTPKEEKQQLETVSKEHVALLEKAIEEQTELIEHLKQNSVPIKTHADLKVDYEETEAERLLNFEKYKEEREKYQKEHSVVIHLDAELENVREELRQAQTNIRRYAEENEHLRGLLRIWI